MNKAVQASDKVQAALDEGVLLRTRGLEKSFTQGGEVLRILQGVDIAIDAGEIVALVGPSGSGKSTLLQMIGLLDMPSAGSIMVGGCDVSQMNDRARTSVRRNDIGFVYQFHHLLPEFSALENVALPQIVAGVRRKVAQEKAAGLLEQLGLGHRSDHRPARLSGGEQQRVAIARALANDPKLLFADEPTGNLDPDTSAEVFDIFLREVRERKIGVLIATHNMDLADQMDRVLELKSGRVITY